MAAVDFEDAKDKVLLGTERKQHDHERRGPIIPRGMALGVTQTLPVEDRFNLTRKQMVAMIRHAMGGRAAEELIFDHYSTGASNDLQQATNMAREMICRYGMSEAIGPVSFDDEGGDVFLGRDFAQRKNYSEKTAQQIDDEVKALLTGLYDEAKQLLTDNRAVLDSIADALLERETLETSDLERLAAGEPLPPMPTPPATPSGSGGARAKSSDDSGESDLGGGKLPDPEPMPS